VHLEDLDFCEYHAPVLTATGWAVPLRAVGWLEYPHPFPVGTVAPDAVSKLIKLVQSTREKFPHYQFRGVHNCSLCAAGGKAGPAAAGWSQENILVPGVNEIFAAPGGIVHYITDHDYVPPSAFLEAVVTCPDCASPEYMDALRKANAGHDIPVKTNAEDYAEFRAQVEATLAARAKQ
jgi:hypothetical protein